MATYCGVKDCKEKAEKCHYGAVNRHYCYTHFLKRLEFEKKYGVEGKFYKPK